MRWIYWEPETRLLGEKSPAYWPNVFDGNWAIVTQQRPRNEWFPCQVISQLGCLDLLDRSATIFPVYLSEGPGKACSEQRLPNLPKSVTQFLERRALQAEHLFHHVVSVLHAPAYGSQNAAALRLDWPRVPIPQTEEVLRDSSALGEILAALLNPEIPVSAVSTGTLRQELRSFGVPTKIGSGGLTEVDFALTAGWGSAQNAGIVMPGRGKTVQRDYRPEEAAAFGTASGRLGMPVTDIVSLLGESTFDVYLNGDAYWSNVPSNVWAYTLGSYQVIKKWLSYRERDVLGRNLTPEEVTYVSEMVRRIAAILLLGPRLDANYEAVKKDAASPAAQL